MDYNKIKATAESYKDDMTKFLRAIVKNPGESCDEKAHIETIAAEMKKLASTKLSSIRRVTSSVTWEQATRSSLTMHILIQWYRKH